MLFVYITYKVFMWFNSNMMCVTSGTGEFIPF